MTLCELLESVHGYYLLRLKQAARERKSSDVVLEPVLRSASGTPVRGGLLNTPLRVDLVVLQEHRAVENLRVETEKTLPFSPIEFQWAEGMAVSLGPFGWSDCSVRLAGVTRGADWEILGRRFDKWFDEQDTRPAEPDGLRQAVHFISDPDCSAAGASISIDFGSAPVEAFEELLDAAVELGAQAVHAGMIAEP